MILLTILIFYPVLMGLDFWRMGAPTTACSSASWR